MAHAARILLYFLFAGIGLTLIASGLMWWFEASRRLTRALHSALGKAADAMIYDLDGKKAAGLDFTAGDLAVLWETGSQGLVFAFDEIEGAELIVDERVVARAQKGEPRRVLNETHAQAARVTLRLMFDNVETPEFELNLYGEVSQNPVHAKTAAEAVRLGRKWLSHIDAVIKRLPQNSASQTHTFSEKTALSEKPPLSEKAIEPMQMAPYAGEAVIESTAKRLQAQTYEARGHIDQALPPWEAADQDESFDDRCESERT